MKKELPNLPAVTIERLSGCFSNTQTDPTIVGKKYIFMPNDMGDCFVIDADNLHQGIMANNVMTELHRDLALWNKPWSEMKPRIIDRYLLCDSALTCGDESQRAPGDPFFHGDKVYIRTIEGITCMAEK